MIYVLDCNVALKWFLPEEHSDGAEVLLDRFATGEDVPIAPSLLLAEFGYNLCRRRPILTPEEVRQFWEDFLELGVETVPITGLAREAMQLALDHMANYYDAIYVALAQLRRCPVVTADDAMRRAFAPLGCVTSLQDLPA